MLQTACWQMVSSTPMPLTWVESLRDVNPLGGRFAAQLLWQRGIQKVEHLRAFLDPQYYRPTSPAAFGQEMKWAVQRILQAREAGEKVTIWGDFDADGITATSVLWEGLAEFIPIPANLNYYIPNRLKESHGLNLPQLERLAAAGTRLIITCDTGSSNLRELEAAIALGIDVIITDHHTLSAERPEVVAILNPRYFAHTHPLYSLSGVAVAYKLVEALYLARPDLPAQPLENLLDLVAIGLIADLVELRDDSRYLAQKGIARLQQQGGANPTRPGIHHLLTNCKATGDRPMDISFGLAPRINAISRIQGDASFGVELLTSRDTALCKVLARETELANSRRQDLQKNLVAAVEKELLALDLSTTGVIVLENSQWPTGILGLVAGQIAQRYGRPTILLSSENITQTKTVIARGSARSAQGINLYELLESQQAWMISFGGHPLAAGLSLPLENLPFFREAINQQFWQNYGGQALRPEIQVDLSLAIADLGQALFRELKLLEPYGMGNPVPRLWIKNCRFEQALNKNITDRQTKRVVHFLTSFQLTDAHSGQQFPGVWWGHRPQELPGAEICDVLVELDFNTYSQNYEVRLIDFKSVASSPLPIPQAPPAIVDRRGTGAKTPLSGYCLDSAPLSWWELHQAYQQALEGQPNPQPLILNYNFSPLSLSQRLDRLSQLWDQGVPTVSQLQNQLGIKTITAQRILGLPNPHSATAIADLLREEDFQRRYFAEIPLGVIQERLGATT
jgi:single-stranded-DNA-specific exonuclease